MGLEGKRAATRAVLLNVLFATGLGLAACGGGGDSDLQLGSAAAGNEAKGNGVVAVGDPVANAMLQITCAGGTPFSVAADANGAFTFPAEKQVLPCAVRASGGTVAGVANTQTLHSVFYTFGRVNVTPLTDLLVARLAAEDPVAYVDSFTSGNRSGKISADTAAAASSELQQYLAALGVDTTSLTSFNLITGSFTPATGDAHDAVLESLAARLSANALTLTTARAALVSFTLPGPCSDATGFCWPTTSYKLLAQGRVNEKGEPEAKFHEHDVDLAVKADGSWTKTVTLKSDKVGKILNYDIDVAARGLRFTGKYQSGNPGNCGYATPASEACYEALYASMVMVCGANAGDDFILMPYATVQKDSAAEVKKEAVTPLYGLTFGRIVACGKADTVFAVSATGQVSDGSDASITGLISAHIGKDWSAKKVERKFWKVTSGTQTKYIGIESGTKNGQPHFVVLVSQ
ncbi:hypothetical protein [Sphaerotilus sp.]|uniref:hypothetical protein n=1 Tax=Sphaerotilus sp. TaxID=2093942 RepID=UPI002ACEF11C|nr:hypothetical protein [Sphaerotilus sp.]MDZ7855831.1 hypothetical protein [Sphaerotilus sp.]